MRLTDRSSLVPLVCTVLAVLPAVACDNGEYATNPGGTLPPIRTTTTLSSTETTLTPYFLHYKLKAGDNLGAVAAAFEVPLDVLIEFNKDTLGANPSNLPIGTVIVIPPHRWIDELPTTSTTAAPDS